jgi:hypothetical protein
MSLGFLAFALILARWGLVLGVCFVLYRRLSLPALPWLAGHYAITAVWSPFGRYIGKHVPDYVNSFQNVGGSTLMLIVGGTLLLAETCSFIIALLILSELAYFVSSHHPEIQSKLLSTVSSVHSYIPWLGVALICITLIQPISVLLVWSHRHASTVP